MTIPREMRIANEKCTDFLIVTLLMAVIVSCTDGPVIVQTDRSVIVQMVPVIVQMAPAISCAEDRDGRRVAPQEHREMLRSLAARSGL